MQKDQSLETSVQTLHVYVELAVQAGAGVLAAALSRAAKAQRVGLVVCTECCTLPVEWRSFRGWRAILRAENRFLSLGSMPEKAFSTFRPMSSQPPVGFPNRRLKLLYCFNGNFFS